MTSSGTPSTNSRPRRSKASARKSTPTTSKSKTTARSDLDALIVGCAKVAADIKKAFSIIRPPKRMRVSEWAREHARLKDGSRYRPWPPQVEMLDVMGLPATKKVSVMKSTRVGYTQILLAYLGYRIDHDPGNLLMARPTIDDTKKFFKEHVAAVLRWPVMKSLGLFSASTALNTVTEKYFPGFSLKGIGANSPGGFRDHDADCVISDEIDGFPTTAGVEGDQMNLLGERLAQSNDPKDIAGSTPTEEAISKIAKRFAASDQRHYHVQCPICETHQRLVWGQGKKDEPGLRWAPFKEPTEFWYQCVNGCRIPEAKKLWMLEHGFWKAEFPEVYERTGHAGFHINALYSLQPNAKWPNLVEKFLGSYKTPSKYKTFVNTTLGETWKVSGDKPDWQRLADRRDDWQAGIVPYGGCFLTAAVDVQAGGGGRLEVFVIAHGRGGSTWLVEHKEFMGSPYEPKVWDQLSEFARRKWPHENGTSMMELQKIGVDVGYATRPAYNWCRKMGLDFAMPIRGSQNLVAPAIAASTTMELQNKQGSKSKTSEIRVHMIGGHMLKQELYGLLNLDKPLTSDQPYPLGYVHIPLWLDVDTLKELVAEYWHEEKAEWVQTGANEFLDGWCYNKAMAIARGAEKWTEAEWAALEAIYGHPAFVEPVEPEQQRISQAAEEPHVEDEPVAEPEIARPVSQSFRPRKQSWLYG
ncbi:MAG: phage terminase large subunit family protein [Allorhizobium sp.]